MSPSGTMALILLVEDDEYLSKMTRYELETEGYLVVQAFDGLDALELAAQHDPDLVLLDLTLPGIDGLEVCQRLRETSTVPILMLTARSTLDDRVRGLLEGADDYLVKPFLVEELKARVIALLRRVEMMSDDPQAGVDPVLMVSGLRIDPLTREVALDGQSIDLTIREFDLLYILVSSPGRVFGREFLLGEIWGEESSQTKTSRTVDTQIHRLRYKLGLESNIAQRIVSLRGVGYRFEWE